MRYVGWQKQSGSSTRIKRSANQFDPERNVPVQLRSGARYDKALISWYARQQQHERSNATNSWRGAQASRPDKQTDVRHINESIENEREIKRKRRQEVGQPAQSNIEAVSREYEHEAHQECCILRCISANWIVFDCEHEKGLLAWTSTTESEWIGSRTWRTREHIHAAAEHDKQHRRCTPPTRKHSISRLQLKAICLIELLDRGAEDDFYNSKRIKAEDEDSVEKSERRFDKWGSQKPDSGHWRSCTGARWSNWQADRRRRQQKILPSARVTYRGRQSKLRQRWHQRLWPRCLSSTLSNSNNWRLQAQKTESLHRLPCQEGRSPLQRPIPGCNRLQSLHQQENTNLKSQPDNEEAKSSNFI